LSGNVSVASSNVCGLSALKTKAVTVNSCTVGIDEAEDQKMKIYPNPANNVIYIENLFNAVNIKNKQINIVDVLGKRVISSVANSVVHQIDISTLSKGLYFIQINDGITTYKFIKE
jgi:type IX secretion system substrate protein